MALTVEYSNNAITTNRGLPHNEVSLSILRIILKYIL